MDELLKGAVADSQLSVALAKPLADAKSAMELTVQAAQTWQVAINGFEKVLAEYGIKVESPPTH